ncbi:PREDICTED: ninja-family protein AFP1-like [Camelina sativa]|uniref:Ninja-family protein n=1 Tax=Camelina sativa TaxID=90675 RepID=A0ABM0Z8K9_CAMSA|nr:PREDICTED: ninja-family protein AFP1-like [Camelina sativa]
MAEANERSREMGRRSNSCVFPRDLLQSFISNSVDDDEDDEEEDDEVELNLGLSLGGRFGVDKSCKNKLVRSSSVVVTMPLFREVHRQTTTTTTAERTTTAATRTTMRGMGLMRTTSLPAESEEEWRKRKEMQTLRRMAAKRRRSEKLRSGGAGNSSNNPEEAATTAATTSRRRGRPSSGLPRWSATANKSGLLRQRSGVLEGSSVESQGGGGGSSSVSELETKASSDEARSLPSSTTQQLQQQQEATTNPTTNRLRRLSSVDMNMKMEPQGKGKSEMPCVFTKGDGPNGKRVDGILYRYGNGEEVRIMCVCHGDFLSPADFVKHAGGPNVEHPLRHIVVNTSSPSNNLL